MANDIMKNYQYEESENGKSQYAGIDFRDTYGVEARYIHVDSDKGNPFIEALPPHIERKELQLIANKAIPYNWEEEHKKTTFDKILSIIRLEELRFQLPMNSSLEDACLIALVSSYRRRRLFYDEDVEVDYVARGKEAFSNGYLISNAVGDVTTGFMLIGFSGCGKSSALETLFSHYPQYIIHHGRGIATYPQVVYLVVQCPPYSNFRGLYKNIGAALDRALGNVKPVYELMLDAGERGNLSRYKDKVRELIEKFAIGLIVFDEIQHLSFNKNAEASFETILELANETKCAFAVVGTEDARSRLLLKRGGSGRQIRRLGEEIQADNYCGDMELFTAMCKQLFTYQWFDEPVPLTAELIDALFQKTYGIVALLIRVYIFMNIDYIKRKKKPIIDAAYVDAVIKRHFPAMIDIVDDMKESDKELQIARAVKESKAEIQNIQDEEANKKNMEIAKAGLAEAGTIAAAKSEAMSSILRVTDDYSIDEIESAMNEILAEEETLSAMDPGKLIKKTFQKLQKTSRKKSSSKKASQKNIENKLEEKYQEILTDSFPQDDELL